MSNDIERKRVPSQRKSDFAGTSLGVTMRVHRGDGVVADMRRALQELNDAENDSRTAGYPTPGINIAALTNALIAKWTTRRDEIIDEISPRGGKLSPSECDRLIGEIDDICEELKAAPVTLVTLIHKGNAIAFRVNDDRLSANAATRALRERGFPATAANVARPLMPLLAGWEKVRDEAIKAAETNKRDDITKATKRVADYCALLAASPKVAELARRADTTFETRLRDEIRELREVLDEQVTTLACAAEQVEDEMLANKLREFVRLIKRVPSPVRIASFPALEAHKKHLEQFCAQATELTTLSVR